MDSKIFNHLLCPQSLQRLDYVAADDEKFGSWLQSLVIGKTSDLSGLLVRQDRRVVYLVRAGIPVLLASAAIEIVKSNGAIANESA